MKKKRYDRLSDFAMAIEQSVSTQHYIISFSSFRLFYKILLDNVNSNF